MTQSSTEDSAPGETIAAVALVAELQPVFEDLGLNGYQARVLLALLQAGSATAIQLAQLSSVPRTSVYPVLKELAAKHLATQVAGRSSSWVSPGVDEVLELLTDEHRRRVDSIETRLGSARVLLSQLANPAREGSLPYVQVIHSATQSRLAFERALAATRQELLMFTRPPWSWPKEGTGNETVLGALLRGVVARALYMAPDITGGSAQSRAELEQYHAAGTEGRVVDELSMKLAIFDRRVALLALDGAPVTSDSGFPTSLLVEHRGYAELQALAFEQLFSEAVPYERFIVSVTP